MRNAILSLVLLPGCLGADGLQWGPAGPPTSSQGLLMSTSSASAEAESLALSDNGETLYVDMSGTTWCTFRADDGYMSTDSEADEEIVVEDVQGDTPLVRTRRGLARIDTNGTTTPYWALGSPVVAARHRTEGAVALSEDAGLRWFDGAGETQSVRTGSCTDLALDVAGDTAWLACEDGFAIAQGIELQRVDVGQALTAVAWSESAAAAAGLGADGRTLVAVDADGSTLWQVTSAARVSSLVAVAGLPLFAVITGGEGESAVELISADTGETVDRLEVEATSLRAAKDAPRLAVYGGWSTWVYEVSGG